MKSSIWSVFKPYLVGIIALIVFSLAQNALNLIVPKLIASGIDSFATGTFNASRTGLAFGLVALGIFAFIALQNVLQVIVSERVSRNLRRQISEKISRQSFQFVQNQGASKLLTNLTSDVDGVKAFVSQAIPSMVSSVFLIIGASVLLFLTNWKLALAVMAIIPIIGVTFAVVFSRIGDLFKKAQMVVDRLNRVINESILGAALIRVLHAQPIEYGKFSEVNTQSKVIGIDILKMFASMIPIIMAISNAALVVVFVLGGHFVIMGSMSIGDLTAFNSYIAILIFPIMMLGFLGSVIGRATASYKRIAEVIDAPDRIEGGEKTVALTGALELEHISWVADEKNILKDVSLSIKPRSRTAIIGPTAAGKTVLLNMMTGLVDPTSGTVKYDGVSLEDLNRPAFYKQTGIVFQDSVMFNLSIRENILFGGEGNESDMNKAIETAELSELIGELPEGLNTLVSERGTSLSGGQKQRIMLARALALNPKILFLDDFTARVDVRTEEKIVANLAKNYPDLTLVSVTQKVTTASAYDQVILLMEGEILANGTHEELLKTSPEYVQIVDSQNSTTSYEHN